MEQRDVRFVVLNAFKLRCNESETVDNVNQAWDFGTTNGKSVHRLFSMFRSSNVEIDHQWGASLSSCFVQHWAVKEEVEETPTSTAPELSPELTVSQRLLHFCIGSLWLMKNGCCMTTGIKQHSGSITGITETQVQTQIAPTESPDLCVVYCQDSGALSVFAAGPNYHKCVQLNVCHQKMCNKWTSARQSLRVSYCCRTGLVRMCHLLAGKKLMAWGTKFCLTLLIFQTWPHLTIPCFLIWVISWETNGLQTRMWGCMSLAISLAAVMPISITMAFLHWKPITHSV